MFTPEKFTILLLSVGRTRFYGQRLPCCESVSLVCLIIVIIIIIINKVLIKVMLNKVIAQALYIVCG